jgi:hypothetical protein
MKGFEGDEERQRIEKSLAILCFLDFALIGYFLAAFLGS